MHQFELALIEVPSQHWLTIACEHLSEALGFSPESQSATHVYVLMMNAAARISRLQKELDDVNLRLSKEETHT